MTFSTRGCFSSQRATAMALLQWRSMRKRQGLQAAQRQETVEGPGDGADGVLQDRSRRSWRSAFSPTTSTPPTMSEWPFRYLVAECMTMSKPSSSGRCT